MYRKGSGESHRDGISLAGLIRAFPVAGSRLGCFRGLVA